jgi:hypothetical protein
VPALNGPKPALDFGKAGLEGLSRPELEFLKRLWGLGTGEEEGYRTGPPGYIGWRNSFLGIDSGAPYTFKNTSSGNTEILIHTGKGGGGINQ